MDFLIASFGTSGDVLPVIRLGAALRSRGHRVGVLAAAAFQGRVMAAGLEFYPTADNSATQAAARDAPLLATRYRALFIQRYAVNWNDRLLAVVATMAPRHPCLLCVERPFVWADLYCHSRWGMPCLRLVMDVPLPRHWQIGAQLPPGRIQSVLTARIHRDWASRIRGRGWRSGPAQITRLSHSVLPRLPRLGLWPSWIAARGTPLRVTRSFGFLLEPTRPPRDRVPPDRPILVFVTGTTGTTQHWELPYLKTCVEICRRLGRDGVMLGATEISLGTTVPPWFRCERFLPLEQLLPRADAMVHHGGIGTCALALYHGVPQLVVPRVFGQPVNADLMRRLGVGLVLSPEKFSAESAVRCLQDLQSRPSYRTRAQAVGEHMHPAHDLMNLTSFIEEFCRNPVSPRPAMAGTMK